LEVLHQIADGEVRRIALAVVAVLLADLEGRHVRHGQLLTAIPAALEDGANQVLMLPGEAAKQDCSAGTLVARKSAFNRTMEMRGLVEPGNLAQASALGLQSLFDFTVIFNLDKIRRHVFLQRCMKFVFC
jgi:hypothetical protein